MTDLTDYPAVDGRPVHEGHAALCAMHGHASHVADGRVTGICPRCGEHAPYRVDVLDVAPRAAWHDVDRPVTTWRELSGMFADVHAAHVAARMCADAGAFRTRVTYAPSGAKYGTFYASDSAAAR